MGQSFRLVFHIYNKSYKIMLKKKKGTLTYTKQTKIQ